MNNLIHEALLNIINKRGCKGLITIFDFIKVDLRESINVKILFITLYLITIFIISYIFYFEDSYYVNRNVIEIIYESYYLLVAVLITVITINIFKVISIFKIRRLILDYENVFLIKVNTSNNDVLCDNVILIFENMLSELAVLTGVNIYTIFTILNKQIKHTFIKLI